MLEHYDYHLKVMEITLPPLRERRDDIPLLVDHFRNLFNDRFKKRIAGISGDVLRCFMNYSWSGNVRELEHAMERAFVLCRQEAIMLDDIPVEIQECREANGAGLGNQPPRGSEDVVGALKKTDWNKAKAARLLGIHRTTLYRRMAKQEMTRSA